MSVSCRIRLSCDWIRAWLDGTVYASMPASPITDEQVSEALDVAKHIPFESEAWEGALTTWDGKPAKKIIVEPEKPLTWAQGMFILVRDVPEHEAAMVGLSVILTPKLKPMICRYDYHDGIHRNPPWCDISEINMGQFHRHVYNVRAFKELNRWDACAEPINQPKNENLPPQRRLAHLKSRFVEDLEIEFLDKHGARLIFDRP